MVKGRKVAVYYVARNDVVDLSSHNGAHTVERLWSSGRRYGHTSSPTEQHGTSPQLILFYLTSSAKRKSR